jgi:phospholipid N-methyltransferase
MVQLILNIIKRIGYWLWSSRWLARRLVLASGIHKKKWITILELWAGYGNVTHEIIKNLPHDNKLIALEYDLTRVDELRHLSGVNIEVIHGSVENLEKYISKESIDVVISTLPLWSFEKKSVHLTLKNIDHVLKKWGLYIQYQYWMANKNDIKNIFTIKKILFEPRNFTPAFIYISEKEW